ncbi:MAG: PQQ-binding-like beta-propeller repeat protein, partial [Planctomycetaceae bacterium]|nr:PQQ-binding-like beta-propeller repeat protein [Planctomycetaceae bacterium]
MANAFTLAQSRYDESKPNRFENLIYTPAMRISMPIRFLCYLLLLTLTLLHSNATAENWTRFRGPNGSGISSATTVPVKWSDKDYRWTAELPGEGHSSPVVWGDRLFVTSADGKTGIRYLVCLNALTGEQLWKKQFEFEKYKKHNNNSFASNTPTVDEAFVYVLWQSPESSTLSAFSHQGDKAWTEDLGPYRHGQGGGTSPVIFEDMVVVSNDHGQGSFLAAYDRKTGEERWKVPREGKRASYSTPCVYRPAGQPAELIFTHCFEGVIGVDPQTGKQKWMVDPFGRFPQRAVVSPFVAGDL